MQNRDKLSDYIAARGYLVTDDGDAWHIAIPVSSPDGDGWDTITVYNWREVMAALGY